MGSHFYPYPYSVFTVAPSCFFERVRINLEPLRHHRFVSRQSIRETSKDTVLSTNHSSAFQQLSGRQFKFCSPVPTVLLPLGDSFASLEKHIFSKKGLVCHLLRVLCSRHSFTTSTLFRRPWHLFHRIRTITREAAMALYPTNYRRMESVSPSPIDRKGGIRSMTWNK